MVKKESKLKQQVKLFSGHKPNLSGHKFPEIEYIYEELSLNGYCIIPDQISNENINECIDEVDRLLLKQENDFGIDSLTAINDRGVVRSPFLYSKLTREVCFNNFVFKLLNRVFGDQYVLHVNRAVVSDPNLVHPASVWHREPPYVDFTASQELALTFAHVINESNKDNGGLTLLPGSHKWENFPSDEYVHRNAICPYIPAGSLLVFNSLVFHCGTQNNSNDLRRSFVTIFTSPIIKQQVDIPNMIRENKCEYIVDEISHGDFFYGFSTELRKSDLEYRTKKLEEANKNSDTKNITY